MKTIRNIILTTLTVTLLWFATASYSKDYDAINKQFDHYYGGTPHTGIILQTRDGAINVTLLGIKGKPSDMCSMFSGMNVANIITVNAGRYRAAACK